MDTNPRIPLPIAGLFVLVAVLYLAAAVRLPFGTPDQLGPGVYPALVGLLLFGSSLGLAFQSWRGSQVVQARVEWPTGMARWRMAAVVGASAGYILLMPYLGDAAAGVLAMLIVLRVMGMRRWLVACALAVGMALTFHYVFVDMLSIHLPRGILFD